MKNQNSFDQLISNVLSNKAEEISEREELKNKIDNKILLQMQRQNRKDSVQFMSGKNKNKTIRWNIKKGVIAAAALCVIVPTFAFAGGKVAGYVTSLGMESKFSAYDEIDKAQEEAGFACNSIESFSNGYSYAEMYVSGVDKMDEYGNRFGTFKKLYITYTKENFPKIDMVMNEIQPEESSRLPDAKTTIGEIEVTYQVDHYKTVPEDYELTEEDNANALQDNYFISVGSDEVEEEDIVFIQWEKEGIHYMMMSRENNMSAEEFFAMAEEIIMTAE